MLETESIMLEMELTALEMLEACQDSSCFSLFLLRSLLGGSLPQVAVRS
jgi:hypothetical protein